MNDLQRKAKHYQVAAVELERAGDYFKASSCWYEAEVIREALGDEATADGCLAEAVRCMRQAQKEG